MFFSSDKGEAPSSRASFDFEQVGSQEASDLLPALERGFSFEIDRDRIGSCQSSTSNHSLTLYRVLLFASLLCNAVLILGRFGRAVISVDDAIVEPGSSFARLTYSSEYEIKYPLMSGPHSPEGSDELWIDYKHLGLGMVALDNSYVDEKGLLPSQKFVWDDTKSLYVLNGFHLLHCLQMIHLDIGEFHDGRPANSHSFPPSHVAHCLSALRSHVICEADDTPLYFNKAGLGAGEGQKRQCRDWSRLEAWASEHDACYRKIQPGNTTLPEMERFKFCRHDSAYLPKVRQYFGYDKNWLPD